MELNKITGSKTKGKKTRVGRGGKRGKTSGRGTKGQKARAGNKRRPEWRDTIKKLPKRRGHGKNRARTVVPMLAARAITLDTLAKKFKDNDVVTVALLMKAGLVARSGGKIPPVKILGTGVLTKKLTLKGITASQGAKEAIVKSGGTVLGA